MGNISSIKLIHMVRRDMKLTKESYVVSITDRCWKCGEQIALSKAYACADGFDTNVIHVSCYERMEEEDD